MKPITVIGNYPPEVVGPADLGVGNYVRSKYRALASRMRDMPGSGTVQIIAEILAGDRPRTDADGPVAVHRLWRRGSARALGSLLALAFRQPRNSTILIELEFNMFRSWITLIGLVPVIAILKWRGVPVITQFHQVVRSATIIREHFDLGSRIHARLLWWALNSYCAAIARLSREYVTHEDAFTDYLAAISRKPGRTIHHGVWITDKEKLAVRQRMDWPADQPVLLIFGYLNWYKGIELALDFYEALREQYRDSRAPLLVVAGTISPSKEHTPELCEYWSEQLARARRLGVRTPGFVPSEQLSDYFSGADLAIFPYRAAVSSSGPFAYAIGHCLPFLLSNELSIYLDAPEIRRTFDEAQVDPQQLVYSDKATFIRAVTVLLTDNELRKRIIEALFKVRQQRSWEATAGRFLSLIGAASDDARPL